MRRKSSKKFSKGAQTTPDAALRFHTARLTLPGMDHQFSPVRAAQQSIAAWRAAGVTHVLKRQQEPVPVAPRSAGPPPSISPASTDLPSVNPTSSSDHSHDRVGRLAAVALRVAACTRCDELARTRKQTVFGVGNPQARVMFIGEAPGADEDAQGEPFVGRAGQLLNRIIAACGWQRSDLYICNILRCRPPGNRTPEPHEAANCREYLDAQIEIVDPEYIVCWGSCATQNLLGVTDPIGRMRQRWYSHGRAKVLCTYHPSYLLRNPAAKKPVWDDMLFLLNDMGLQPPATPTQ